MLKYLFSGHAFKRMTERGFSPENIRAVIANGSVIQEYPDDKPYPSKLILGFIGKRPIHVVSAYDMVTDTEYVITVYEPDTNLWSEDFTRRR